MLPKLGDIWLWNLPSPTWKSVLPHGGRQWGKRKGKPIATHEFFSRNTLNWNSFPKKLITSQNVNSVTLWMQQMTICANMWRRILNSCLRFGICMSQITCAILWWGFWLGPNTSSKIIGLPHYPRPSWKWKVFRMWDEVKSPSSKRITRSFTRKHTMKANGIKGKIFQKGKNPNNFKVWVSNPKEISSRRGHL